MNCNANICMYASTNTTSFTAAAASASATTTPTLSPLPLSISINARSHFKQVCERIQSPEGFWVLGSLGRLRRNFGFQKQCCSLEACCQNCARQENGGILTATLVSWLRVHDRVSQLADTMAESSGLHGMLERSLSSLLQFLFRLCLKKLQARSIGVRKHRYSLCFYGCSSQPCSSWQRRPRMAHAVWCALSRKCFDSSSLSWASPEKGILWIHQNWDLKPQSPEPCQHPVLSQAVCSTTSTTRWMMKCTALWCGPSGPRLSICRSSRMKPLAILMLVLMGCASEIECLLEV